MKAAIAAVTGGTEMMPTRRCRLRLLAEFQLLVDGIVISLPHSVERIVAFLAINSAPVRRGRLAASLWPDVADDRANGDLRSALWRLRRVTGVIHESDNRLTLSPGTVVDVSEMTDLTRALLEEPARPALDRVSDLVNGEEILPSWDEEWLIAARERYRLLRLRALERSAEALLAHGAHTQALDAALACAETEPYRESAHRLLVRIHLAEGNHAEALRAYRSFRRLLDEDLGIAPSAQMEDLMGSLTRGSRLTAH